MFLVTLLVSGLAFAQEVAGSDTGAFSQAASQGLFMALATSFGIGFIASLTPCVYPMIVITVSIFGANEAKSRWHAAFLSGMFVLGIVTLFAPLGVAAALSGKSLGSALGNPWVVGFIALVFTTLAASMFGAFELALPASLTNKLSGVGGVGAKGAFGLGLVCALLAAPCTGPGLTGLAIWIATTKNIALGLGAMTMFALGLGVPFFVVGTFAIGLPKGGAWMLGIKWICGVALAYMALAYVRDMPMPALQQLAVPSSLYAVVAGGVLAVGLALASVHVAAERRRSPIAHLSKPMKLASIMPAIAGVFMLFTWYPLHEAAANAEAPVAGAAVAAPPLKWETDEAAGRQRATAENKALIIDFGATWCGACKEMEEKTFPTAQVRAEGTRFVAVKVDGTDDEAPQYKAMQKKYGIVGLPTVLLLDKTGKEVVRFTEFVPPEKFSAAMKKVN